MLFQECLEIGRKLLLDARPSNKLHLGDQRSMFDNATAHLRWLLLPSEAAAWLENPTQAAKMTPQTLPFVPPGL